MAATKLVRTTTFRLALIYLALFALSVVAVLGFVYVVTTGFMGRQTDETIDAEIQGLYEQYTRRGVLGVRQVVSERSRNQRFSLYLLTAGDTLPLAGNLDSWPRVEPDPEGRVDFRYERPIGGEVEIHDARGRVVTMPGGFRLLVARDVEERRAVVDLLKDALAWSLGLTLLLGLGGGILFSRNLLRRIDAITDTSREIMGGDLGRRLPVRGSGDELDRLAESLNAMLDQIEALMTAMRQVTDNIAHDLRTPLTRLRSRLEVTLLEEPSVPAYRAALEESVEETSKIIQTFNALLAIARLESGAERQVMGPVDLASLVADVGELYEPVAEEQGISLSWEAEPGLVAKGNARLLSQALGNLVDNALKYTPAGGSVTVAARSDGGRPTLSVRDTGPGIPESDRDRVFDRFVRLEASRHTPGSGLGLAVVRAVAQLHGAEIVVGDAAPGLMVEIGLDPFTPEA